MTRHFLCDTHIPPRLAAWLRSRGHEAAHVIDLKLETSDDLIIWRYACEQNAVVITKDRDFAQISRRLPGTQVVLVQLGNCTNRQLLDRFGAQLGSLLGELDSGERLVELH